jgi:hypothetical protein
MSKNANFLAALALKMADFAKDEQKCKFLSALDKMADFAKDEQKCKFLSALDKMAIFCEVSLVTNKNANFIVKWINGIS